MALYAPTRVNATDMEWRQTHNFQIGGFYKIQEGAAARSIHSSIWDWLKYSSLQWRFWGLHFGGQWGGHNCSWGHGPILPQ